MENIFTREYGILYVDKMDRKNKVSEDETSGPSQADSYNLTAF